MSYIAKYRLLYSSFFIAAGASIWWAITEDGMGWWLLASLVYAHIMGFFGTSIGLHRYFSHNSFKTGPLRHKFFLALSVINGQGSPISWSSLHIYHHKYSDTELDIHGPDLGIIHSIFTWGLFLHPRVREAKLILPKHLLRQPDILWVHRNYFNIWAILILISATISIKFLVLFLLAPAAWSITKSNIVSNYLEHVSWFPGSYQNYHDVDHSFNNRYLQAFVWGEGLHNNHHKHQGDYRQSKTPGEIDPGAWFVEKLFKI